MIYITGYFGVKNLGDEAIAQVAAHQLRTFDPIVTPGDFTKGVPKAVVVGGGEYDSWMIENAPQDVPLFASGVGFVRDLVGEKRASEIRRFRQVWIRTHADMRLAQCWNFKANLGSDPVVLMEPTSEGAGKDCDVVFSIKGLTSLMMEDFHHPLVIPLHEWDKPTKLTTYWTLPNYQDPQTVLNSLVGARRVITWGRLHPHILAFVAGVPCVDLAPTHKTLAWMEMQERYSLMEMRRRATMMFDSIGEEIENGIFG